MNLPKTFVFLFKFFINYNEKKNKRKIFRIVCFLQINYKTLKIKHKMNFSFLYFTLSFKLKLNMQYNKRIHRIEF